MPPYPVTYSMHVQGTCRDGYRGVMDAMCKDVDTWEIFNDCVESKFYAKVL